MIFPAGPLLAQAIATAENGHILGDMFDALRYRGRRGLSTLPATQVGSMEHAGARYTLRFEGVIPAPHETRAKLTYRGGMGYGVPTSVQYNEEAVITETESPLSGQRRIDVETSAWVSIPGEAAITMLESMIGRRLEEAVSHFPPLGPVMKHVISEAESHNGVTRIQLETNSWTEEIIAGQLAHGSTADLIGRDPNFLLVTDSKPVLQSVVNGRGAVW